jgi:hypothetical protein
VKFEQPLVSVREGWKERVPGLDASTDEFCRQHCLGREIANLLKTKGFKSPSSLVYATDLGLLKGGFKIGHVAELRWALKGMLEKELADEVKAKEAVLWGAPLISCCAALAAHLRVHVS